MALSVAAAIGGGLPERALQAQRRCRVSAGYKGAG